MGTNSEIACGGAAGCAAATEQYTNMHRSIANIVCSASLNPSPLFCRPEPEPVRKYSLRYQVLSSASRFLGRALPSASERLVEFFVTACTRILRKTPSGGHPIGRWASDAAQHSVAAVLKNWPEARSQTLSRFIEMDLLQVRAANGAALVAQLIAIARIARDRRMMKP